MPSDVMKIKLYFPDSPKAKRAQKHLGHLVIESMRKDGSLDYVGYLDEESFQKDLLEHIGDNKSDAYKSPSLKQKEVIEKNILRAAKKSHKVLPHPDLPIFIFVYPWFPSSNDAALFGGVTAFSTYYTMHIFIDLNTFTDESLQQTVAHEWNHLVFYRYHPEKNHKLIKHMIMEGLAEIFREEVMGGKPAPWSLALTKEESQKQFKSLRNELNKKGIGIYKEVFFGNKKYKRWTGYSIGYRLAKEFRKKNRKLSWPDIIRKQPEDF